MPRRQNARSACRVARGKTARARERLEAHRQVLGDEDGGEGVGGGVGEEGLRVELGVAGERPLR